MTQQVLATAAAAAAAIANIYSIFAKYIYTFFKHDLYKIEFFRSCQKEKKETINEHDSSERQIDKIKFTAILTIQLNTKSN